WIDNPFYGIGREPIELLSPQFDPNYQDTKRRYGFRRASKPVWYGGEEEMLPRHATFTLERVLSCGRVGAEQAAKHAARAFQLAAEAEPTADEPDGWDAAVTANIQASDFTIYFGPAESYTADKIAQRCLIDARKCWIISPRDLE